MKIIAWIVGVLITIILVAGIAQMIASERVEVVEISTLDEAGEAVSTRLWIVDDEGFQYLRGDSRSGWGARLIANPQLELTRSDTTASYKVVQRPDKVETLNRLMHEKYTWGDELIEIMIGGRSNTIAFELHPSDS